jgi:GT2 family glycosyltransferase
MTLVGPHDGMPEISVVMVTHGAWPLTERALGALRNNTDAALELIIVDNASTDQTRRHLADLDGALVLLNDENDGFGPATNRGAAHARADLLLLLNSDAFVSPGWLGPLREALREPGTGAAIPQLLHPDGSLQDAGALLAQDGTVLMYGDGDDPSEPAYRFRRAVDYGGAACLLLPRGLFQSLGGFDPMYAPAYYEDADLGLRIAERGLNVLYEPRSQVTHVRYGSGTAEAAVSLSERNRARFVERWSHRLIGRPWTFRGTSEQAIIAARDALATPRVLICAPADHPHAAQLASVLPRHWPRARVTWATQTAAGADAGRDALLRRGVEILEAPPAAWLGARLFHYDLAILDSEADRSLTAVLDATQPQAARAMLSELGGVPEDLSSLMAVMTAAGVAPPE